MLNVGELPVETVNRPEIPQADNRQLNHLAKKAWQAAHIDDWQKWRATPEEPVPVNKMLKLLQEAYEIGRAARPVVPPKLARKKSKRLIFTSATNILLLSPQYRAEDADKSEDRRMEVQDYLEFHRFEMNAEDPQNAINVYLTDGRMTTLYRSDIELPGKPTEVED